MKRLIPSLLLLLASFSAAQTATVITGPIKDTFGNPYTGQITFQSQAKTNTGYAITGCGTGNPSTCRSVFVTGGVVNGLALIPNDTSVPNLTSYVATFSNGDLWLCIVPTSASPIAFTAACAPNATAPNVGLSVTASQIIPGVSNGQFLQVANGISTWAPLQAAAPITISSLGVIGGIPPPPTTGGPYCLLNTPVGGNYSLSWSTSCGGGGGSLSLLSLTNSQLLALTNAQLLTLTN